jgi:hypothetical protein
MLKTSRFTTFLLIFSIFNFSSIDLTLASKALKQHSQENVYNNDLLKEYSSEALNFQPFNSLLAQSNFRKVVEAGTFLKKHFQNRLDPQYINIFRKYVYSLPQSQFAPPTHLTSYEQNVISQLYSRGIGVNIRRDNIGRLLRDNKGRIIVVLSLGGGYTIYCSYDQNQNKLFCPTQEQ